MTINALADVDLTKPIPELRLKDGTVLHDVRIKSYGNATVMVRHNNGAGTIKYELFPDDLLPALNAARRDEIAKNEPPPNQNVTKFMQFLAVPLPEGISLDDWYGTHEQSLLIGFVQRPAEAASKTMRLFVEFLRNTKTVGAGYDVRFIALEPESATDQLRFSIALTPKRSPAAKIEEAKAEEAARPFSSLPREKQLQVIANGAPQLSPQPEFGTNLSERALFARKVQGQIFVATKGGATFKLSSVQVCVYPRSYAKAFAKWAQDPNQLYNLALSHLKGEVSTSTMSSGDITALDHLHSTLQAEVWQKIAASGHVVATDADGRFEIESPYSEFAIFASAQRSLGSRTEHYIWLLTDDKIPDRDRVLLDTNAMTDEWVTTEAE